MKRPYLPFAFCLIEALSYFGIIYALFALLAIPQDSPESHIVRFAAAPRLIFAVAFFLIGYDPSRFALVRKIVAIAKAFELVVFFPFSISSFGLLPPDLAASLILISIITLIGASGLIEIAYCVFSQSLAKAEASAPPLIPVEGASIPDSLESVNVPGSIDAAEPVQSTLPSRWNDSPEE